MKNKKQVSTFLDTSMIRLSELLEENIPKALKNEHFKLNVTMTHDSGHEFNAGICRCKDENGVYRFMDCRDCPHHH